MSDSVRPSLVSQIKEDGMEYSDDPFLSSGMMRNSLNTFGNPVGNKPVGFERSKVINESPVNTRVTVPPLFSSLPHSEYDSNGMRHERSESVGCAPLLTPVDFPGFNYPSTDMPRPLLSNTAIDTSPIQQPIVEELDKTEQFRQLMSQPINIPRMDTFHIEKPLSLSPKSPKMEQNVSRSPKSGPRSPKGLPKSPHQPKSPLQPKSPHQAKSDSKVAGKKKTYHEKYQVPPRLKKKAKSHEITSNNLRPEQQSEKRRKSLPATLCNPMLTSIKERANYLPTMECENISLDVPDKTMVKVIPEEDELSDGVNAMTEDADMDVLLNEINSTTNIKDNEDEEDDEFDSILGSRKILSVENHKMSNFGKRFDDEKVEMPKQIFIDKQEEALHEARMSLSQLNAGAKEFVPRTTTTPEPKLEDSDSISGDLEFSKPMMQEQASKNTRGMVQLIVPSSGGKLAFQQPNGHEASKYVLVSTVPYVLLPVQPVSPDHYMQSNATPPNSHLGSPVLSRRPTTAGPGTKKKKRKNKSKKKDSEPKGQSSKESIDENDSDRTSVIIDNAPSKISSKEESMIPKPVNVGDVPIWPKIRSTIYKAQKKTEMTGPEEPERLPDGKVLCLMRGLPGSGKTTLARKLQREGVIYSTDDYFMKRNGDYEYKRELLTKAHEWNQKRVHEALEKGITPVIVDNTHIQKHEMRPYIDMAKKMNYYVVIRTPDTPWKRNPNQLAKRCVHGVPKEKIISLLDIYDPEMTVEKVMGWKSDSEMIVKSNNTRTVAENNANNDNCDQKGLNKRTEHNQIKNGCKQENDVNKPEAQRGQMSTAQQRLTHVRKLGNVVSPVIYADFNTTEESSVDQRSEVKIKKVPPDRPLPQATSSETKRISNKKRIHSLIKEDKIEISDDDEIDRNIHGDSFEGEPDIFFDDVNQLESNHKVAAVTRKAAAVNVYPIDFALLQRIEAGLQDIDSLQNVTVLTAVRSNFIPSECCDSAPGIPLIAMLDKGSMTLDFETDDYYDEEIKTFLNCFPSVPKEDLLHVLEQCDNNTQWASEILLDSNLCQPNSSPAQQTTSAGNSLLTEPSKERATALQEESSAANPCIPSDTATDLDIASKASQVQDNLNIAKDTNPEVERLLVLQLDASFLRKLHERFGDGSYADLGLAAAEDLQVAVQHDLASRIYNAWLETLKNKYLAENRSTNIGKLKADEDFAKKLQQEEDYLHMKEVQEAKLTTLKRRPWLRSGHNYQANMVDIMPDGTASYHQPGLKEGSEEIGLREIMDQERNLQLVNDLFQPLPDESFLATKIKRDMLFKRFPKIDKDVLENLFSASQYNLSNTIRNIESSYNLHPEPIHIVLSAKAREELERQLLLQAEEDIQKTTSDTVDHQLDTNEELDIDYPDDAEYVDFRVNAILHRQLQAECLQKASEAHQKGQGQLASYYAEKGREHKEKIKEANQDAANRIHQTLNKNYLKSNILDLHHFHVDEAINVLQEALLKKKQELKVMEQKPKTLHLSVITGRGKNSPQGIARIRQAVQEHLKKHNYQFYENTPGIVKISLKPIIC